MSPSDPTPSNDARDPAEAGPPAELRKVPAQAESAPNVEVERVPDDDGPQEVRIYAELVHPLTGLASVDKDLARLVLENLREAEEGARALHAKQAEYIHKDVGRQRDETARGQSIARLVFLAYLAVVLTMFLVDSENAAKVMPHLIGWPVAAWTAVLLGGKAADVFFLRANQADQGSDEGE
jgi:hypothetical protein